MELGATTMPIHHLLRMGRGAVIELGTTEKDPLKIYANNTLIALGEIKVDDGPAIRRDDPRRSIGQLGPQPETAGFIA